MSKLSRRLSPAPAHLQASFEDLVAEAASAPVDGWEFSWLDGRATEERPSWGYARTIAAQMERAGATLDVETGGGELLAEVLSRVVDPPIAIAATEGWAPNVEHARRNLRRFGVGVVGAADGHDLPFRSGSFDLIVSRHPITVQWAEIARALRPGGTYLSQQVGAGSNRELTDFMMGPQEVGEARSSSRAAEGAEGAGLTVVDLREETLRTEFADVGAVVYFLRKVPWTVPGFTVDAYRSQLGQLQDRIRREGPFVAHSRRFLIEATKPV